MTVRPGLLLDVGGVVIRTPFEMLEPAEDRLGLERGALGARGPFDPDGDAEFDRVRAGQLTERAYWRRRAARAAPVLDAEPTTAALFAMLYDVDERRVVRPGVRALLEGCHRDGRACGLLTNDLQDFHGRSWVEQMAVFGLADAVVDGSRTGVLKPAPEAFRLGIEAMGLPASQIVFVDDQPVNVRAGAEAGLRAVPFDPTAVEASVDHVRSALR